MKMIQANEFLVKSRGVEFEASLPRKVCPAGYYCPNKVPPTGCSDATCPEANTINYYEANAFQEPVPEPLAEGDGTSKERDLFKDGRLRGGFVSMDRLLLRRDISRRCIKILFTNNAITKPRKKISRKKVCFFFVFCIIQLA